MILNTFNKQPAEVLDYDIDYSSALDTGDTIVAHTVTAETGITVDTSVIVGGVYVKIWLSGGTNGATYKITLTVTTAAGRVREDEIKLKIKDY